MNDSSPRLSFEFFPTRTAEGKEKLVGVRDQLNAFAPDFFSVTYGAGGSTRENTKGVITSLREANIAAAPHLSFGGDSEETILQLLNEYKAMGVERIVALRGDVPSGMGGMHQMVYANELVAFIQRHCEGDFHIEVAAYPEIHPQAKSYSDDVRYLKGKFDAGANSAITQYFFNPDSYFYFIDQCQKQGITQPIYPGIMPILNYRNLIRFSDSCGTDIPRWLRKALENYGDDDASLRSFGIELVTELCEVLLENDAPGLHFYTMNQTEPTAQIVTNLGLIPTE